MPASSHILALTLFSVFQEVYPGCCMVAARRILKNVPVVRKPLCYVNERSLA